jgi:electron transfer flavoprotein beta subunit
MDTANTPRPPAARKLMKYKRALSPAEVAKKVADAAPDASKEAQAAQAAARCAELKAAGLLIEQWNLDDVGADLTWCGMSGSPTKVNRIQSVVLTGGEYRQYAANDQSISQLVAELIQDHTIG